MRLRHIAAIGAAISISLAASSSWSAVSFTILGHSPNGAGNTADTYAGSYGGHTPAGATWFSIVALPGGNPDGSPLVTPPPGNSTNNFLSPFAKTALQDAQSCFSRGGVV